MYIDVPSFLCSNFAKQELSKIPQGPKGEKRPADVNARAGDPLGLGIVGLAAVCGMVAGASLVVALIARIWERRD